MIRRLLRTLRRRRRHPRAIPTRRNPPMSAQGLRLLNDVSAATIRAQRARCCDEIEPPEGTP